MSASEKKTKGEGRKSASLKSSKTEKPEKSAKSAKTEIESQAPKKLKKLETVKERSSKKAVLDDSTKLNKLNEPSLKKEKKLKKKKSEKTALTSKTSKEAKEGREGKEAKEGRETKEGKEGSSKDSPKRKLGIKGAAPWAARHAAKHAAEARARAAEPAPPGSARATIRTPSGADELKEKLNELNKVTQQLKALQKNLTKNFFEIGLLLREIQARRLFEARGFSTFDIFVERETALPKEQGLKITRISGLFVREGAVEIGLEKLLLAMSVLDAPKEQAPETKPVQTPLRPPSSSVPRQVEPSGRAF